jgi:PKD repeat protein
MQRYLATIALASLLFSLSALAGAAQRTVEVRWASSSVEADSIAGFHLYLDEQVTPACSTDDPASRFMRCIVETSAEEASFSMTAYDVFGLESERSSPYVYRFEPIAQPLTASFISTIIDDAPLTVYFDASSSTGVPNGWIWNFGDGSQGVGEATSHTYDASGTFTVQLTVSSDDGQAETSQAVTVNATTGNAMPKAVIASDATAGPAPLTGRFDGRSSSDPDGDRLSLLWDFGDSSPVVSKQLTRHTFTSPGVYTVTLTVSDGRGGNNSATLPVVVTAASGGSSVELVQMPKAILSYSKDKTTVSESDTIFIISLDGSRSIASEADARITQYAWNFGDGSTGSGSLIRHQYHGGGRYLVTLTVTDTLGKQDKVSLSLLLQEAAGEVTPDFLLPIYQLLLLGGER